MTIVTIISPVVSFYLVIAFFIWIVLMAFSVYKLKPYRVKQDVRGAFLKTAMLTTTTTTGFLFAVSAIYLIINYTFVQIGQVPDTLLVVAFFGSGILFIWTLGNFLAEIRGDKLEAGTISSVPQVVPEVSLTVHKTEAAVLPLLRRFNVRWEQYQREPKNTRWQSPALNDAKTEARFTSRRLLDYIAEDQSLTKTLSEQIRTLADSLQKFGTYKIDTAGPWPWEDMDKIGTTAYTLSLILLHELHH